MPRGHPTELRAFAPEREVKMPRAKKQVKKPKRRYTRVRGEASALAITQNKVGHCARRFGVTEKIIREWAARDREEKESLTELLSKTKAAMGIGVEQKLTQQRIERAAKDGDIQVFIHWLEVGLQRGYFGKAEEVFRLFGQESKVTHAR